MWAAEYLCAHRLSERFHQAPGTHLERAAPMLPRAGLRAAGSRPPHTDAIAFPLLPWVQPRSRRPDPMRTSVFQLARPGAQQVGFAEPKPGGPPRRGSGAGAHRPGSSPHGVRPRATTRDPGAAPTPRVLCCSRRDAGPQQSRQRRPHPAPGLDAAGDTETAEGPAGWKVGGVPGGVARGPPAVGPLLGARSFSVQGFASPLVRCGERGQPPVGRRSLSRALRALRRSAPAPRLHSEA